jgi:hypothetical protein
MAIFPQGLTAIDQRCNPGERRVLQQLKRCLDDDHVVWHDVPIGPRARQPDFVVLSMRWGVLMLEVKDWKRSSFVSATRDAVELQTPRGRVTVAHPLRQVRDVLMEMVDLMSADPALVRPDGHFKGKLLCPYGSGVVMSGIRKSEVAGTDFEAVFPASRTLLRDDLDPAVDPGDFQARLWGLFTLHFPHNLTLPQRDRIRWHLFPEVRMPTQVALDFDAASRPNAVPPLAALDLLQVMDLQQEQVARSLGEGHRVIHGAAGSGKTMILVFRAQYLAQTVQPDEPVLVMCFNRSLADRIDAMLRARGVDERVQVRTFHAWCQDMVRSYQLDVPSNLTGSAYFEALADVIERAIERGRVPGGQYSALLIDEAHDFEDAWLRMAPKLVKPSTRSLLVLYDDAQSIYQQRRRRFSFASVGIDARGRTSVLKVNYRNTQQVLALAVQCAQTLLAPTGGDRSEDEPQLVQPASAGRPGPMPVLVEATNETEEARLLVDRIVAERDGGVPLSDIAVITRTRVQMSPIEAALRRAGVAFQSMNQQGFRHFDWRQPSIKLVTMHSAKGLEFSRVFVAGLQALPWKDESIDEAVRLLYVAMTRSTRELVLSAHGRSTVVRQVKAALQAVAEREAAASAQADQRSVAAPAGASRLG